MEKYHNILGEDDVEGERDKDSTVVGGRNTATVYVADATSCVPNNCLYGQLYTYSSGGMAPASPQAPPPSYDIQSIGHAISIDSINIPGRVKELYCRFKEERLSW